MPPKAPKPPKHLSRSATAWWRKVVSTYELEPTHLLLLQGAAELWDRLQNARERVEKEGAIIADRFGCPREHPAAKLERDSKIVFCRMVRELALDIEPPAEPPEASAFAAKYLS